MSKAIPRVWTFGVVVFSLGSAGCDAKQDATKVAELEASQDPAATTSGTAANDATPPATRQQVSENCSDLGKAPSDPPSSFLPPPGKSNQTQGFDVSQAQGDVPWKTLSQTRAGFVYVRASEGTNITDRKFEPNWEMSKHCGFPRGAYHVYNPLQDPDDQAAHFLGLLGDDVGELPVVLDVEYHESWAKGQPFPDPEAYVSGLVKMAQALEDKTGWAPMIYIQPWYWNAYLGGSKEVTKYFLWAAGTAPPASKGWSWSFWQHGPHMHWDNRGWDHDIFDGSSEALRSFIESKGKEGAPSSGG